MPESRMPRSFELPTAVSPGTSCLVFETTGQDLRGSPEPAECVCTQSFSIRAIRRGSTLRFQRPVRFVLTTEVRPGDLLTKVSFRNTYQIRPPKSATAFT